MKETKSLKRENKVTYKSVILLFKGVDINTKAIDEPQQFGLCSVGSSGYL